MRNLALRYVPCEHAIFTDKNLNTVSGLHSQRQILFIAGGRNREGSRQRLQRTRNAYIQPVFILSAVNVKRYRII